MRVQQVFEALLDDLMRTLTTRAQHRHAGLRYRGSLGVSRSESAWTNAEWAVLEPLLPPACGRGRPPCWPLRQAVDAVFNVLRGGCPWRVLPKNLPPSRNDPPEACQRG